MKKYLNLIFIFLPLTTPTHTHAQQQDYQLIIMGEKICTKSHATCLQAQIAIIKGWFLPELAPGTPSTCRPHPNCFTQSSNVIKGYNDK